MRLVRSLAFAAFGLSVVGFGSAVGCGSTTTNVGGNGDGGGGGGGGGGTGGEAGPGSEGGTGTLTKAPTKPSGPATTSTTPQNFAIHQLFLGDTDNNTSLTPDTNAWAGFGYDIDGKITTAASTNVCTLTSGGGSYGTMAQVDGNGGIDNSFGENVFATFIKGLDPTVSATILSDLNAGDFTLMFDIVGLSSSATQTATGLTAQAFAGAAFGTTPPTFTTADNWPILGGTGLLSSTSPITSTIQFTDAYVVNGTWVSGTPTNIMLSLSISGVSLTLPINNAVITFQHTSATHGANGQISGVIPVSELVSGITSLADSLGLCNGVSSFLPEIEDAADIGADGTNNPGTSCNGISIGLGFTVDEIGQPSTIAPTVCKPNKCGTSSCGDGGTGDSGGSDAGAG